MKPKQTKTRFAALLLTLSMLLSMLPPLISTAETDATGGTSQSSTYGQATGTCSCGGSYINGFCTVCGGYLQPSKDANGVYQIANAGNLYWFAQQVNAANSTIDGKLTADIVVNKDLLSSLKFDDNGDVTNGDDFRMWTPIGYFESTQDCVGYHGTFDGANHTVSGLYYNGSNKCVGLFGFIGNGAHIKNVGIVDNYFCVTSVNGACVGGVIGRAWYSGMTWYAETSVSYDPIIESCYHAGRIYVDGPWCDVGGVLGRLVSDVEVKNCYNIGSVTGNGSSVGGVIVSSSVGGVIGYIGAKEGTATVEKCYNTGSVSGSESDLGDIAGYIDVVHGVANVKNCYHLSTSGNEAYHYDEPEDIDGRGDFDNICAKSADEFATGAVAWLLNGSTSDGVWKQTLGSDTVPNFTGQTVYPTYKCSGAVITGYANRSIVTDHIAYNAETGMCEDCGKAIVAKAEFGSETWYYESLEEAFAAASGKTATITLLRDTTHSTTAEISGSNTNITLIGGEYTVSAKCTMFKITGGTLTVKSGTYTTTLGNVIEVSGSTTDSTTSSGSGSSSDEGIFVPSIDIGTKLPTTTVGTVNIEGGNFTSESGNAVYVTSVSTEDSSSVVGSVEQGTANITGGTFIGSSHAVYVDKASGAGAIFGNCGKLNVSGGTFGKLYVAGIPIDEVELTGGTFTGVEVGQSATPGSAPCAAILADGYAFFDGNGKGVKLTDVSGDNAGTVKLCTEHSWDSASGKCIYCATSCAEHIWDSATGSCTNCGYVHDHGSWTDGVCDDCGYHCPHGSWESAACTVCGVVCAHPSWNAATGCCTVCDTPCAHGETDDNGCAVCGYAYRVGVTVKNAINPDDEGTTTYYFTLEDAIAAAVKACAKGNSSSTYIIKQIVTVTLLSDVTLTGTVEIANSAADIILVGGEHTVSATNTIFRITGGSLTVQSGNYITTGGNVFYVGGKVTLPTASSDIYVGTTTETTASGTVNISGGSFTSAGHTVYVTRVIESSEKDGEFTVYTAMGRANISGGVFTSTDGYAIYNASDDSDRIAGGDLGVSGGEFNGGLYIGGVSALVVDDNTITLSGGRFSRVNCYSSSALGGYLPQYYAFFTADENGAYTVPTVAKNVNASGTAVEVKPCTHVYTNADGICDACGKESGFVFAGYTLTLDGTIGMNFYTSFSDEFAKSETALVRFKMGDETLEFKPADARDGTLDGASYKVFTIPVCAYEMNLEITACALLDGNLIASDKSSVRAYAEYIIAPRNGYEQKHIDFAVALLNYGAAAQEHFDLDTGDLANKSLSDEQKSVPSLDADDLKEFDADKSADATFGSFIGMNLVLYSETCLNVYFEPAQGVDIDEIKFTVGGDTAKYEISGGCYRIPCKDIKAHRLDDAVTFAATYGDETITYTCSAMTYCYKVLDKDIDATYTQTLRELICALREYNIKSEIYGGNNEK